MEYIVILLILLIGVMALGRARERTDEAFSTDDVFSLEFGRGWEADYQRHAAEVAATSMERASVARRTLAQGPGALGRGRAAAPASWTRWPRTASRGR